MQIKHLQSFALLKLPQLQADLTVKDYGKQP